MLLTQRISQIREFCFWQILWLCDFKMLCRLLAILEREVAVSKVFIFIYFSRNTFQVSKLYFEYLGVTYCSLENISRPRNKGRSSSFLRLFLGWVQLSKQTIKTPSIKERELNPEGLAHWVARTTMQMTYSKVGKSFVFATLSLLVEQVSRWS